MMNPFRELTKKEWVLWIISFVIVTVSNIMTGDVSLIKLAATDIGVTALIFIAKGNVWGQILVVIFSILYAITSYDFRYYGEMITYLGMTAPIAVMSIVSWLRHPYEEDRNVVEINTLSVKQTVCMWVLATVATALFGVILTALDTPNLFFSIVSVTTSFLASYMMLFRSSWYAVAYAANDMVLIILWILATVENFAYLPMILCFATFLVNDLYGFISWKLREQKQARAAG
ncbi:MAG: nicotinamide riboside transporter PnuC [Bacillota bacterium]|nr:nicotinamide riboside transporter PnuC [Bacillota bacterium]